jgi:hypothetical protein
MVGVTIAGRWSVPFLLLHIKEAYFDQRHLVAEMQTRREIQEKVPSLHLKPVKPGRWRIKLQGVRVSIWTAREPD